MSTPKSKIPNKPEEIIQQTTHSDSDKEHALKILFKNDDAPVLKSVGYSAVPGIKGHGGFVSYVITSQGDKVLSIEVEQPNLRNIAEESSKMAFVDTFMGKFE